MSIVAFFLGCMPAGLALNVSAASAILVEAESGRILYEHNSRQRRLIASTTKLMTALVAVQSGHALGETVEIRQEWTGIEGSSIYLRPGERVTLGTLLYGLLLESGNDAAQAVAGFCGGEECFVARMNETARRLGMRDSCFENPSGLDGERHYSTAHDMAQLARAVLQEESLATIVASRSTSVDGRSFTNHNKLLWRYEGCIGLKTGYTQHAGRTLVSAARRDGMTLICVTLNAPDDWKDHETLLDYGFSNFHMEELITAGEQVGTIPLRGSLIPMCPVTAGKTLRWCLGDGEEVQRIVQYSTEEICAPAQKKTQVGRLLFRVNGKAAVTAPLEIRYAAGQDQIRRPDPFEPMKNLFRR